MGTSSSSRGPKGNVPLIPPGVPPLPPPLVPTQSDPNTLPDQQPETALPALPSAISLTQLAPPRRFMSTRTSLGKFAKSGSMDDLKRGLGHYVKTGRGGTVAATQRMGRTANTAGGLYGMLDALRTGTAAPVDLGISAASLTGCTAREIADTIANALQPADGTQDAEAARDAISRAISDLIIAEPEIDLLALAPDQIDRVVEGYISHNLCHHIELDVGKSVLDKAPTAAIGMQRLEGMKEYVCQEVARCFRARAESGERFTRQNAAALAAAVLRDTFEVFEEYIQ